MEESQEELQEVQTTNREIQESRPSGLGILLVLSGISSFFGILSNFGLFFISSGASGLNREEILDQMQRSLKMMGMSQDEALLDNMQTMLEMGMPLALIGMAASVVTLISIVFMFRYKKLGFHLYVGARLVETFMPALIAGSLFFSPFTLFTSSVFVFLYSRYLKLMH